MAQTIDISVPDIGDFKDVPVIEILVKPGDKVKKEDPLVALESEKATMEVPSPGEGVVQEIKVKVGDRVSQGSPILSIAAESTAPTAPASNTAAPPTDDKRPQDNVEESGQVMESAGRAAQAQTPRESQTLELRVPDIGDFKDVPVIEVMVKPGDRVDKETSLVALESEKATMEVPSTDAGVIESVLVKVGDKVSQGAVVATLKTTSASAPQAAPAKAPAPAAPPSAQSAPSEQHAQVRADAPAADSGGSGNGVVHASPSIRRFARELGVDLHNLKGSGPHGRITKDDVQNFVKSALKTGSATPAAGAGLNIAPWPKVDFAKYGPIERQALSRIKQLSGPNLHRNWVMIPHVTNNDDADITQLEKFRLKVNDEQAKRGIKVTLLAFLIKASVAALQKFPEFNSSLDGNELVLKKYYNIGFAADTPNGLVVPVVKDADKKGVVEIAKETAELAAKAREGKLPMADMQGGTFTISSLGGIGGTYFTPIINAPEVAILGVCRSSMRPVWNGKKFAPRLMLPLSLSYDHRVIDGALAARFNTHLIALLADMRRAVL